LFLESFQACILFIQSAGPFVQRLLALFSAPFKSLCFLPFGSDSRFCSGSGPISFFFSFEQYFPAACVSSADLLFCRRPCGFLPPGVQCATEESNSTCQCANQ
jgi:hypothetical protein